MSQLKIIDVNAHNVDKTGFFCYMSKRKTEGFQRKLAWLKARFAEGMQLKLLELPERGFIEAIPGEYAWRAVNAGGYLFIHCLWVVGKSRGQGASGQLLDACIQDARQRGLHGVAMLTSERVWLAGKQVLLRHGFVSVEEFPPFNLMVLKFDDFPAPTFAGNWDEKARQFGSGLTVIQSDQCPYVPDATRTILDFAAEHAIPARVVELRTSQEVRDLSPSPYGIYSVVFNGKLLAYHYLLPKDLQKLWESGELHS